MRLLTLVAFTILLTTSTLCLSSEIRSPNQNQIDDLNQLISNDLEIAPPRQNEVITHSTSDALEFIINEETKKDLGRAVYDNQLWTMKRNEEIYAWQDLSTKLIFAIVVILVFVGVIFAGMQFFKQQQSEALPKDEDSVSHIEISTSGIKVSSPFIGVILLFLSLGFFYLYLVYVYPISLTK